MYLKYFAEKNVSQPVGQMRRCAYRLMFFAGRISQHSALVLGRAPQSGALAVVSTIWYSGGMEKEITTIEGLAELIQNTMASKEDVKGLATKEDVKELRQEMNTRFGEVNTRMDNLDARVGRIQADVSELRGEIVYRHEFDDVLGRVKYLERKLGIESGV